MHSYIYSAHTIGEMLMIACMQLVFNVVPHDKLHSGTQLLACVSATLDFLYVLAPYGVVHFNND